MNLRFLETFLWIVRLGSFSAAGQKLNATQASISHRIQTLEQELGVRLFERTSRTVSLTAAGRDAVPRAEEIIRAVNAFREAIAGPANVQGTIRLGTNDVVVHSFLPKLIERLQESFPALTVDLLVETSANIARELVEERVDLAILMGPVLNEGAVNTYLGAFEASWVASPKYGLAGRALALGDLVEFPILTFSRGSAPHNWLLQQFRDNGLPAPPVSIVNSLVTILQLAARGHGLTAVPRAVIREYLEAGTLEELNVDPPFPPFGFHVAYLDHSDRPLLSTIATVATEASADFVVRAPFENQTPSRVP